MKWFRWYRGTAERAKFRVIAARTSTPGLGGGFVHPDRVDGAVFHTDVLAVWVAVLEDAGNASHWGYVTRDARYIATLLDLGTQEVDAILAGMVEEQMIEHGGKHGYHIVNWEKYQFSSDSDPTNSDRQKRYREKRKSNALLTRTDTDTDTDIKKERGAKAPKKVCNENLFLEFWEVYPRKVARGDAQKAYLKALSRASHAEILAGAKRYKPDPKFTKHPATWLNADCWLDEAPKGNGATIAHGPWKPFVPSEADPIRPDEAERARQVRRMMKARAM
jgi:hypothetical protein